MPRYRRLTPRQMAVVPNMKMKWILTCIALLLLAGSHGSDAPLAEHEGEAQASVVESEQRKIIFVGRLRSLERTVQYCSIPWVGTFEGRDGKIQRFVIGGNDHPLFRALDITVSGGGVIETDLAAQPVLRLGGRSCPIEGVWKLTSWEKTGD